MRRQHAGFTTIELLIVIAVVGIVGTLSLYNLRSLLQGQQVRGTATALQQMLWQGGTSASARLEPVVLSFANNAFVLTGSDSGTVFRTEPLPALVTTNFPTNKTLTFLPSGRADAASYAAITQPIQIKNYKITFAINFSMIGEAKVQVSQ